MHISYDRDGDTAYVSLVARIPDGAAVRQVTVEGLAAEAEVVLDVDEAGRLLGFEVIGARAGLPAELLDRAAPTG
ncbi:DUF2283 domain-containing protein [Streptomyces sp. NBC_01635]|uniref:DUF2283 domain-containing protein n=1 Tax=Streptomyces sp. NBC_01635 TaxID=2975904 RepID=UPI00386C36DE|nr:DUF2283 domain-containing protein [Streptomyces sp. NBC_01635]